MDVPETRERSLPVPAPASRPTAPPLPQGPLQTARLVLRPWREDDIPAVFKICQDPDIQRWTTIPSPYEIGDAEWFVREFTPQGFATGDEATFAALVKETGRIAGAVGLGGIGRLSEGRGVRTAEIGYWANPETRGRGYITEAVREVVRWGFEDLELGRVTWQAFDGNAASRRVVEKLGFTIVGKQRGSHEHRGRRADMWLADVLPGELR
ncbi:GNAT family N-acetyltransferase [Catenulispora subtropica]|uniref:GNAT family N-acetyltransferase n=1 Tax=Catenulispora subtropica TaxID=450798 RepID=A0ABP5CAR8_9ACTN